MKNLYLYLLLCSISALTLTAQVPSYIPTNSLVGWWPFNGNANDESGNGNNGTVNGATLTTDRFGVANKAYSFNGNSNYIAINTMPTNLSQYTYSVWAKADVINQMIEGIAIQTGLLNNIRYGSFGIRASNNGSKFIGVHRKAGGSLEAIDNTFNQDVNWHHYVQTWDGLEIKLFLDGNLVSSIAVDNRGTMRQQLTIGAMYEVDYDHFFDGQIDDFGFWTRALSSAEITGLFTSSIPTTITTNPGNANLCVGQSATLTASTTSSHAPCLANGLPSALNDGLVGYWSFCGNANNVQGGGMNGTVVGATLTTDRFGNANSAYNFNGNSRISIGQTNLTQNLSISFWVRMSQNQFHYPIGLGTNATTQDGYGIGFSSSVPPCPTSSANRFFLYDANNPGCQNVINSTTASTTNTWYQITIVKNGTTTQFYKNGVLESTASNISFNISNLTFGVRSDLMFYYNGILDDVGLWNRALSAQEIAQLYTLIPATYSWSPGGATTPSITVSPTTTTTYTCTITQNGATTTQSQTITVNPLPTVNAGVDQTVFAGASVTLAGSGATSYTWNNGITNNSPFTATTTTTYTVTGATNGCSASDAVLVTVLPAATITPTNATICAGQSTTITVSVTNGATSCSPFANTLANGVLGYWPFCGNANDASGNGNNGSVTGATLTTDRFGTPDNAYFYNPSIASVITTPIGSNINPPFSYSMWVLPSAIITYDGESNTCINSSSYGMYQNNQNWAMVPHHGQNTTLGVGISVGTNSIQSAEHGSFVLESRMTHPGSFANQFQHIVVVYRTDSSFLYVNGVKVRGRALACASTPKVFPSVAYLGGTYTSPNFSGKIDDFAVWNRALSTNEINQLYNFVPTTYLWSNGATTPTITVSPTTTTTYTCTITQNGATTTQSQTITVNPLPTVNAGVDQTVFAGASVTLAGSGATSYTWNNGITNNSPFTATTTTTYTVTGATNGCSASDAVLVTVLPAATITPTNATICAGQSTTITAASASAGTPCASTGLPSSLTNGLVGYWPFCGNANDASGNGNNGTVNGATLTADRFGSANSAYSFDGVNDEITTPRAHLSTFSTSVWVQAMSTDCYKPILDAHNASWELFSDCSNGQLTFIMWNASGYTFYPTNINLVQNTWFHVACVYSSSQIKIYVNGTLITTQNTTPIPAISGLLRIGSSISGAPQYFTGKIDDVGIWNRVLTASEIQVLYNQGQVTFSWSPGGATTPSITVSPTTTTTYTCTITQNGATTTQSQTITVNPIPSVNAGVDQTVFAGASVILAGSGATSYTWNNGVTNNIPFTATTTTTYTVTGTTNGCSATDAVLVTVLPAATITPTNSTICAGQSTTITAASASAGTPCASTGLPGTLSNGLVGYWPFCGNANDVSGNGYNGSVNGATLTADRFGSANSAYSFDGVNDYIIQNSNSAFNSSAITFSSWVNPTILSSIFNTLIKKGDFNTAQNESYCFGLKANNNIFTGIKGNNCNAGVGWVNSDFNVSNTLVGNWNHIVISYINNTTSVYINGQFISSEVDPGNLTFCAGGQISFGAEWSGMLNPFNGKIDDIGIWNRALSATEIQTLYNQGQATYSWSPGGATTPSITVSPTTTTTYTCTITQGGATTTQSQTITVNPSPTVNAGLDQTVFAGASVTLSGSGATSYTWNNGVTNNIPFTATTTTTYTVTGTTNGCSATDAVLVTVLPAATITPTNSTICAGQSTTITAASASAGTPCASTGLPGTLSNGLVGYWPFCGNANDASGNGYNGSVNGAALTTDRFGNANAAYNFNGSNNFISLTNTANVNFTQGATFSGWIRSSDIRMASILDKETYPTAYGYRLNIRDNGEVWTEHGNYGTPITGAGTATAINGYTVNNWIFVVGTLDPNTNVNSIYINGVLINAVTSSANIANNKTIEVGKSTLVQGEFFNGKIDDIGIWNRALTASEIQALYNQGQATYSWSPGGATTPSITVSPTTTTTYTCTITQNGATTTQSQTITVNPLPTVNAGVDQTVFAGASVTLSGSGATSYTWNNGVTNNTPFTATTTTTYTVTGTTNGCSATDAVLVTVLPAPTITPASSTICAGQSTTITAASASAGTPCASTGLPSSLTNGLVGYWPFCGNANDASGNGNNGTVNGATLTADRFGSANSAYSFDGNDLISVNHSNSLLFNQETVTVSYWFSTSNWPTFPESYILSKQTNVGTNQTGFHSYIANQNAISFRYKNGISNPQGNISALINSTSSNWFNVSVVHTNTTDFIYLNGILYSSNPSVSLGGNNTDNLIFGALGSNFSYFYNGKLDDIGIWNRALTASEIQTLYNQGQATYSWSPGGATTPSITVSPTTTTTYTCTITQNGATTTQSQTITVNPLPTVNAGVDQTVFAGASVTLSGSGATSYTWNNGVTNNVPFTATTTTTYTVTGTTNGCSATDDVLVTVLPTPTITPTNATICTGASTTLTAASVSAGTPCASSGLSSSLTNGLVGYWPFCGNANDASGNGNNGMVNGATLTTDRFGNTNSAYSFDGVDDYIDFGNVSNLGNNPITATYGLWVKISDFPLNNPYPYQSAYPILSRRHMDNNGYDWCTQRIESDGKIKFFKDGDGYLGNQAASSIIQFNSWKHFIFIKEGNTLKVYESGQLISSITDNYILNGSPLNLYLAKHGGWNWYFKGQLDDIGIWNRALTASEIQQLYNQGQATYSWSPGGATTPSITVSPTTTTTYTCTITQNGATTTQSQTITVNPIPTVNAGVDQTVFAGASVTLAGSGATTYSWSNGVTNNVPFTATTTTTYTVTGTTNGCSATDAVLVTVLPNATISANPGTTLCSGQSTTLTANVTNAATPCNANGLTGTLNNGLVGYWPFCGNASDVSGNGNNGTVNGATLTTDRFGNTNSAYSFDGVNDFIQVPNSSTLQNISEISAFAWVNISNWFNGYFPILNKSNVQFQYGKYALCLTTNGGIAHLNSAENGFSNPNWQLNQWHQVGYIIQGGQFYIYINGNLLTTAPVGTFPQNPNQALPLIFGADFPGGIEYTNGKLDDIGIWNRALTAAEIQTLYSQGQATFSWSPGGATTPSITVSPSTTTTYTCTVTLNGASSTVSQTVTVNPSPNVTINTNPGQTVCSGTPVTLTASGASSYSWNNSVSNGVSFVPTATQTYTVIGTNSFGCTDTETTTVTVNPTPTATISYSGSLILCQGSTITLTASPGSSYLWSNGQTTQSITVGQSGSYSVQVINASSCSATSAPVNVTVNPLPAPTIIASGPTTFCQGQLVTLTSSGAQSYLWNTSATTQAINVNTSGTYTVTVVDSKGCSGTSAPIQVTVIDNPPANINIIGGTSICAGQSTTLSAPAGAGYSYIWNTGAQTQFLTVSQTGNYTVQVTNTGGCSTVSASVFINISPIPTATISASGPTSFCQGQTVMLTASSANSYLWSNGATSQSIIVSTAGSYSVTVTGQGGCSATSTPVAVNVYTLPSPTIFASGPTTFCQGGSVFLSAPSGYNYLWSNGSSSQNLLVTNSGTYQVLISNSNGCQVVSNPATIVVNPLPNVNAGMDQTVCSGTPVTLIASGANSFTWNNGVINGVAFVPTTTQTYTVTGTNNFGCSAQDQVTVFVNPLPTVSAGPPQSICSGQSAVLVGTGAQFYLWSNGVINGVPFTPISTQTYTVTGYNAAGCSNTATTTITVNPVPTALAGANATITCSNSASGVQIGVAPIAGQQYLWSPATGLSSTTVANPFANPSVTTLYNLLVTNSATGCTNQGTVTVSVNTAGPLASAGPNVEILCSSPNGLQIGTSPVLGLNYSWSPGTGLSATNIANPIANPSATTIYNLTVTNPTTGCSSNATVTVFVNNTSPTVNAGPDQQVCQGQPVTLTASGLNANTFTWSNGVSNGVPFVPTSSGSYTLTGTNSANGCVATDVVNITVNPIPIVNAGPDQTICAGAPVVLTGSGALIYSWNNNVVNGVAFTPTATLTYTVTGTNANGCSGTDQVTVTVGPGLLVNAGPDITVCAGTPVTLTATGASSYNWTNGIINGVAFTPTNTLTYTVTGTSSNGCSGTDAVTVTVVQPPQPVISPSGPITICQGANVVLSTNTAASYQWRLNGTNISGATLQNHIAAVAGTYSVKVTNSAGCAAISNAVSVSIAPNPTPTISPNGPLSICTGASVVLTSSTASSYQWKLNGTDIIGANNQNYTANAPGNYSVSITNAGGCSGNSATVSVSISNINIPVITASGNTTICSGGTLGLSTTANGTLQWYLNSTAISGATNANYVANSAGSYTVTVTNSNGCSATSLPTTVSISTVNTPIITANGPTTICSGGNVGLTTTATGTLQWNLNGTPILNATNANFSATTAGDYTVTVSNIFGCNATSMIMAVSISTVPTPTITANGPTTICTGSNLTLSTTATGSLQWRLNGLAIGGATNSTYTASAAGTYSLTVTNSFGCTATSNNLVLTIGSPSIPIITPNGPLSLCSGGTILLSATAAASYQWKLNGTNIAGATNQTHAATAPGGYTVTVVYPNGCSATSSVTMVNGSIVTTPIIVVNGSTNLCPGSNVELIASGSGSYQWLFNGNPIGTNSANLMANTTGSYTVTVTNSAGCFATSLPTIITASTLTPPIINPAPTATFCPGGSVVLSTNANGNIQWKLNNLNISGATLPNLTCSNQGSYTVTVSTGGCTITSAPTTVTMASAPTVSIAANGSTLICPGSSVQLNATATPGTTLQWFRNGMPVSSGGGTSLNANQTGNYTVIATNAAGCQTTSNTITVNVVQVSLQAMSATTICQGSTVVLQASTGTGYTYQWIKNGYIAINITGVSTYTASVSGTYSVIIYTPNGCAITTNTIQVQVIANPTVSIIATGNTTICSGGSLTLLANTTGSGLTYQWKRNGLNVTPNGNSSSLSVTQAGTYTVTVANQTCPSSSAVNSNAITVTVNPTPTPNISTSATIIPLGGSVTLSTTPVAGLTYQWQKLNGNNFQNIQNATGTSHQANTAGTYRVRATNASGCTGTSATINLTLFQLPVIEDPLKIQKGIVVEMYPNPTDNLLHVVVPDSLVGKQLQLLDINGRVLQTVELFQKHSVLEMQNYARGTYWIKIEEEQPIQIIRN